MIDQVAALIEGYADEPVVVRVVERFEVESGRFFIRIIGLVESIDDDQEKAA